MSSLSDLDPLYYVWEMNGPELRPIYIPSGHLAVPEDEVLNFVSCCCQTGCKTALCFMLKGRSSQKNFFCECHQNLPTKYYHFTFNSCLEIEKLTLKTDIKNPLHFVVEVGVASQ